MFCGSGRFVWVTTMGLYIELCADVIVSAAARRPFLASAAAK
jgi:hypothetical protein